MELGWWNEILLTHMAFYLLLLKKIYGPFPASLWILFFPFSLFILQLTNIDDNGDRKQERRVKSMQHSIPHSLEKAQRPARID